MLGNGLPQFGIALCRAVLGVAISEGLLTSGDDVRRRREIGLADFHVDDVPTGRLQCPGTDQDLKRAFAAHAADSRCYLHN